MFPEFLYLRFNYDAAISLSGIHLIIPLMILFSFVKCLKRHNFSHTRRFPPLRFLNFPDHLFGYSLLFLAAIENHRAILRAYVCPWRLRVVGSWTVIKTSNTSFNEMTFGSNVTCTTSACPVVPVQTCSYVELSIRPPE